MVTADGMDLIVLFCNCSVNFFTETVNLNRQHIIVSQTRLQYFYDMFFKIFLDKMDFYEIV